MNDQSIPFLSGIYYSSVHCNVENVPNVPPPLLSLEVATLIEAVIHMQVRLTSGSWYYGGP